MTIFSPSYPKVSTLAVKMRISIPSSTRVTFFRNPFVMLHRHVTQGTRGERGRQWSKRIWTAIAMCRCNSNAASLNSCIKASTPSFLSAGP
ncbi:MAG: hypothetical protein ACP5VQ_10960 [Phycisphaerae bacterium]